MLLICFMLQRQLLSVSTYAFFFNISPHVSWWDAPGFFTDVILPNLAPSHIKTVYFPHLPRNLGFVISRTKKTMTGITKVKLNETEASASKPWLGRFQQNTSSPTSFFLPRMSAIKITTLQSYCFYHCHICSSMVYKWVIAHNGKITGLKSQYLCSILTLLIKHWGKYLSIS